MRVFALADLHLAFRNDKPMDIFGDRWQNHAERIASNWKAKVSDEDVVLIPGDISWAMTLREAEDDLRFVSELPGTKLLLKGNHDYWWNSVTQLRCALPDGMRCIQNDSVTIGDISFGGTRLWSDPSIAPDEKDVKIYNRELSRLEMSLKSMPSGTEKVVMLHFPPMDEHHRDNGVTALLEQYGVRFCVYGHLHGKAHYGAFNGERNGVVYKLVAADYLNFDPLQII